MRLLVLGGGGFLGFHAVATALAAGARVSVLSRSGRSPVEEESRPLWYPEDQIPQSAIDSSAALAAGLTYRPVEDTARDTLDRARAEAPGEGLDTPASAERERALLDEWRRVAGGR